MAKYIPLDALLAWAKETYLCENASMIRKVCYKQLVEHLNVFEVKEVDLDYIKDELDKVVKIYKPDGDFGWGTLYNIATHFFELGLNSSVPMTWEDIRNIDHILDGMRNENQVFGYPKFYEEALRRFKALKGE